MKGISTHILDLVHGRPATNVTVRLEKQGEAGDWQLLTSARTDQDGRCARLLSEGEVPSAGVYRLRFDTAGYFAAQGLQCLYPVVELTFTAREGESHFHIPLLLSPNGFTTYRGT
jgi:5-hydroxyisourate hydrolase